jgi:hypothetical protein
MSGKPNCYECLHRGDIPGDSHSRCLHPSIPDMGEIGYLMSLVSSRTSGTQIPVNAGIKVSGNKHGIINGWFNWPFNFDPVWLESCSGFIVNQKEVAK